MRNIIAIDGGGSKTLCIMVDEEGTIIGKKLVGCTNHQLCGIKEASQILCETVEALIDEAGVKDEEIAGICAGLAGMDVVQDIILLEKYLSPRVKALEPTILNDIWIALAAGGIESFGAISICGTGHNTGVIAADGTRHGIGALRFVLGNFGGGMMLSEYAIHKACRSYEKTGEYTKLEEEIPKLSQFSNILDLQMQVYQSGYNYRNINGIPNLVDCLALEGDVVSRRLLEDFGSEMGEMTGRLISHTKPGLEILPVVLAGSLHVKSKSSYLRDSFEASLRKYHENIILKPLLLQPVLGAALIALEKLYGTIGNENTTRLFSRMNETFNSF
jgi:Predicted N-acetylglucosamine kinase